MEAQGITHILSLGVQAVSAPSTLVDQMFVDVDDHELAEIHPHLDSIIAFIERGMSHPSGKVLVHCLAGSSRSGSSVIAYLMKTNQLGYFEALRMVQAKRRSVRPNLGFGKQLIKY